MRILFVAGVSPITADPPASATFYRDTLGLPLEGDGYIATENVAGVKHLGVWPLTDAAQSCFGTREWPADVPPPSVTIEFEVDDVVAAVDELEGRGIRLLHGARTEPWGQTVARLLSPDGVLVGLSHTPWLREDAPG
jgi:catechol 2,3-dioxygenase-like lactoylglutathione lyase family enzyme